MNGLDRIIDGIIAEANENAQTYTSEAKKLSDVMLGDASADAEKIIKEAEEKAKEEYSRIIKSAESSAEVTEKKKLLFEKQKIICSVIESAKDRILKLDSPAYFEFSERLLNKFATGEKGEVVLSAKDKERVSESFAKAAAAKNLSISEQTRSIDGGFVLVYGDIEENCSISAIIAAESEALYDSVNEFLF